MKDVERYLFIDDSVLEAIACLFDNEVGLNANALQTLFDIVTFNSVDSIKLQEVKLYDFILGVYKICWAITIRKGIKRIIIICTSSQLLNWSLVWKQNLLMYLYDFLSI